LVQQLLKAGEQVRIATRDGAKAPAGAEKVVGELNEKTISEVVKGADRLFLLVPPGAPPPTEDLILKAAKSAGVKHVVKLSSIGAAGEKPMGLGGHHREREKILEASGMAWTMIRPGFFMTNVMNWLPQIRAGGTVKNNYGDGVMYPIAPEDIAAVAVLSFTQPGHQGKYYELTGEHAITAPQQLEIMGRHWGKPITVIDNPPDQAAEDARKAGTPEPIVAAMKELWINTRANRVKLQSPKAREVLGRPLMTFEEWAKANLPKL
jgi:uncharacterized protein YbjT (DUF2867 family)